MSFRTRLIPAGALVVVLATSALLHARSDLPDAMALQDDGIGPMRLGLDYDATSRAARRVAPDTFMAGIGCGGRDEITYRGRLAGLPATAMAMADGGTVNEVEITLDHLRQAEHEAACIEERDQLAEHFVAKFGPAGDRWTVPKPVSSEHKVQVGPVIVVARWFATGRSCYVSAVYGGADG